MTTISTANVAAVLESAIHAAHKEDEFGEHGSELVDQTTEIVQNGDLREYVITLTFDCGTKKKVRISHA